VDQLPAPAPGLQRLTDLPVGAVARVHDADLDGESRALLRAIGLTDQSVLRVCKQGHPCVIQVRATRIGMSSRIAQHVTVTPLGAGAPDAPLPEPAR
jgi:Fe2+ transport system protein FeoA